MLQSFSNKDFFLPAEKDIALRFVIASDGHYGQEATDYDLHHNNMVGWLNNELKRGADFAFINGDLFHNDPQYLLPVKQKWDGLQMPYHVSHGNHDQTGFDNWKNVWGTDVNYSFDKDDCGFIVLNTATEQGDYACADAAIAKEYLEKYAHKKHVFVFMHITPVKWTGGGIDCPEIVALFSQQKNLRVIFHGHDHDIDSVKEKNGKHYFFDSHIAGNWGTEYRGYRVVEVLKSGTILTYQMNAAIEKQVNKNKIS